MISPIIFEVLSIFRGHTSNISLLSLLFSILINPGSIDNSLIIYLSFILMKSFIFDRISIFKISSLILSSFGVCDSLYISIPNPDFITYSNSTFTLICLRLLRRSILLLRPRLFCRSTTRMCILSTFSCCSTMTSSFTSCLLYHYKMMLTFSNKVLFKTCRML
jgi:hypothetical protein